MGNSDSETAIDWHRELEVHRDWLHRIAAARLGDPHAADDVVQEVSLAVIRQQARPDNPDKVRPWLYQVVVRRAMDHLRRLFRHDNLVQDFAHTCPTEGRAIGGWDWVLACEQRHLLGRALVRLPAEERQMLLLKYTENWTYRQLSDKFQVSERAIEYRLVRAKQQLRSELNATEQDRRES